MKRGLQFNGTNIQCEANIFQLERAVTITLSKQNQDLVDVVVQQPFRECLPVSLLGNTIALSNISNWLSDKIQKQVFIFSSVEFEYDGKTEIELFKFLTENIRNQE